MSKSIKDNLLSENDFSAYKEVGDNNNTPKKEKIKKSDALLSEDDFSAYGEKKKDGEATTPILPNGTKDIYQSSLELQLPQKIKNNEAVKNVTNLSQQYLPALFGNDKDFNSFLTSLSDGNNKYSSTASQLLKKPTKEGKGLFIKSLMLGIQDGDTESLSKLRDFVSSNLNKQREAVKQKATVDKYGTSTMQKGSGDGFLITPIMGDKVVTTIDAPTNQYNDLTKRLNDALSSLNIYHNNSTYSKKKQAANGDVTKIDFVDYNKERLKFFGKTELTETEKKVESATSNNWTVKLGKAYQKFSNTADGIESALVAAQSEYDDLSERSKTDTSLIPQLDELKKSVDKLQNEKDNVLNKFPEVRRESVAEILGNKISEMHPVANFHVTKKDIADAAAEIEKEKGNKLPSNYWGDVLEITMATSGLSSPVPLQGTIGALGRSLQNFSINFDQLTGIGNENDNAAFKLGLSQSAYMKGTAKSGGAAQTMIIAPDGKSYIPKDNKENFHVFDPIHNIGATLNNTMRVVGGALPMVATFIGTEGLGNVIGEGLTGVAEVSELAGETNLLTQTARGFNANKELINKAAAFYVTGYNDNHDKAEELIKGGGSVKDLERSVVATALTTLDMLSYEIVGQNVGSLITNSIKKSVGKDLVEYIDKNGIESLTDKAKFVDVLKNSYLPRLTVALGKDAGKMGIASGLQTAFKDMLSKAVDPNVKTTNISEYSDIVTEGAVVGFALGLAGHVMNTKSQTVKALTRDALFDAATSSDKFIQRYNDAVENGTMSRKDANEAIRVVKTAREIYYDTNYDIYYDKDGRPLSTSKVKKILTEKVLQRASENLIEDKKERNEIREASQSRIDELKADGVNDWVDINDTNIIKSLDIKPLEEGRQGKSIEKIEDIDAASMYEVNGEEMLGADVLNEIENKSNDYQHQESEAPKEVVVSEQPIDETATETPTEKTTTNKPIFIRHFDAGGEQGKDAPIKGYDEKTGEVSDELQKEVELAADDYSKSKSKDDVIVLNHSDYKRTIQSAELVKKELEKRGFTNVELETNKLNPIVPTEAEQKVGMLAEPKDSTQKISLEKNESRDGGYKIISDGEWVGDFDLIKEGNKWVVDVVSVNEKSRKQGIGKQAYIKGNEIVKLKGEGTLESSGNFSGSNAQKIWESLVKDGLAIKTDSESWRFKTDNELKYKDIEEKDVPKEVKDILKKEKDESKAIESINKLGYNYYLDGEENEHYQIKKEQPKEAEQKGGMLAEPLNETLKKVKPFLAESEANTKVTDIVTKMNNAEYVNENDLYKAATHLEDLVNKSKNDSISRLVNPLIDKILDYEFATKTETRTVTEKIPTTSIRETRNKAKEVSKSIGQFEGSRARFTDAKGNKVEGYIKSDGNNYSIFDLDGNKIGVIGDRTISDLHTQLPSIEEVPNPIKIGKDGMPESITLQLNKVDMENGGIKPDKIITIDFKDKEKALDYAIQLRAEQIGIEPDSEFETTYEEVQNQITEEVPTKDLSAVEKQQSEQEPTKDQLIKEAQRIDEGTKAYEGQNVPLGFTHSSVLRMMDALEQAKVDLQKELGSEPTSRQIYEKAADIYPTIEKDYEYGKVPNKEADISDNLNNNQNGENDEAVNQKEGGKKDGQKGSGKKSQKGNVLDTEVGDGGDEPPTPANSFGAVSESELPTGLRRSILNYDRLNRGVQEMVKNASYTFKGVWDSIVKDAKEGRFNPDTFFKDIFNRDLEAIKKDNEGIALNKTEFAKLNFHRLDILNEIATLKDNLSKMDKEKDVDAIGMGLSQMDNLNAKLDAVENFIFQKGSKAGEALGMLNLLTDQNYQLQKWSKELAKIFGIESSSLPMEFQERLRKMDEQYKSKLDELNNHIEKLKQEAAENKFKKDTTKSKATKANSKVADDLRKIADKIEKSFKAKMPDGTQKSGIDFDIQKKVADAIRFIADKIEEGNIPDLIQRAIDKFGGDDKNSFKSKIYDELKSNGIDEKMYNGLTTKDKSIGEITDIAKEKNTTALNDEMARPLKDLMNSYLKSGEAKSLSDLVSKVNDDLKGILPEMNERDIRDAYSGYGVKGEGLSDLQKEQAKLRQSAKDISEYQDLNSKINDKSLSPFEQARIQARLEELAPKVHEYEKSMGIEPIDQTLSPEQKALINLDNSKKRIQSVIDKLNDDIEKGGRDKKYGNSDISDDELDMLKKEKEGLQSRLNDLEYSKQTLEQKLKASENILKQAISKYEKKLAEKTDKYKITKKPSDEILSLKKELEINKDLTDEQKSEKQDRINKLEQREQENKLIKRRLDKLRKEYENMKRENTSKEDYAKIQTDRINEQLENRIADIQEKIDNKDYSNDIPEKDIFQDKRTLQLQSDLVKINKEYKAIKGKAEFNQRSLASKWFKTLALYKKFNILSHISSLIKLGAAAAENIAIRPILQGGGALFYQTLGRIPYLKKNLFNKAITEGVPSLAAEKAAWKAFAKGGRSWSEFLSEVKNGYTELGLLHGKDVYLDDKVLPKEYKDTWNFWHNNVFGIPGQAHGSIKSLPKSAEFERAYILGKESFIRQNGRMPDEMEQLAIGNYAYKKACNIILLGDNVVSKQWNKWIDTGYRSDKLANNVIALIADQAVPIVKIPTNMVWEAGKWKFGAHVAATRIVTGSIIDGIAAMRGKESKYGLKAMSGEEADKLLDALKKGSVGLAITMAMGIMPQYFAASPFYNRKLSKNKDYEGDLEEGQSVMFGYKVPRILNDHPMFLMMRAETTFNNALKAYTDYAINHGKDMDSNWQQMYTEWQATSAMTSGLLNEIPFAQALAGGYDYFNPSSEGKLETNLGRYVSSWIPAQGFLMDVAKMTDDEGGVKNLIQDETHRKAEDFVDVLKLNFPFTRRTVDENK